jgi:hypothetical protein
MAEPEDLMHTEGPGLHNGRISRDSVYPVNEPVMGDVQFFVEM